MINDGKIDMNDANTDSTDKTNQQNSNAKLN